jgi:hypothetical protein|nr:MAG TPA: hypothetical protein [Bacteriophage sp.]
MIHNVSAGDITKILAAHRAAERSNAVDGLGYLRKAEKENPVKVVPTEDLFEDLLEEVDDKEQKDFEEFLKVIGAITLAGMLDKLEQEKEEEVSPLEELLRHQAALDQRASKRKAAGLIAVLNGLLG